MKLWAFAKLAEDGHNTIGAGELLKAHKARTVAEQTAARLPLRGLCRQRGLAHAAHRVQHDATITAEKAFKDVKLPRPALETILRWRGNAPVDRGLVAGGSHAGGGHPRRQRNGYDA